MNSTDIREEQARVGREMARKETLSLPRRVNGATGEKATWGSKTITKKPMFKQELAGHELHLKQLEESGARIRLMVAAGEHVTCFEGLLKHSDKYTMTVSIEATASHMGADAELQVGPSPIKSVVSKHSVVMWTVIEKKEAND